MMKICYNLHLRDESLFMAVEMFDAHISRYPARLSDVELIAITSLFISTKYEEVLIHFYFKIYPP